MHLTQQCSRKTLKASNSGLINHQECLYLILEHIFVKEIIVKIHFLNCQISYTHHADLKSEKIRVNHCGTRIIYPLQHVLCHYSTAQLKK